MIKAAIEKILSLATPNYFEDENEGRTYTDKPLHLIKPPHTEKLTFCTLKGFADIIKREFEDYDDLMVAVGENYAYAFSNIHFEDKERDYPYYAKADIPDFRFGQYMSYENMMIALKSKFVPTDELNELVKLLGTIIEENHTSISDDGFTQSVNVKQGVALIGNKAINPIVKLKPFRTFIEVDQSESEFLIRLRQGGEVALFEADGGAWKLQARANIAEKLHALLNDAEGILIVE